MSKNLRKSSLITAWAVNCGESKGCYIISMDAMSNITPFPLTRSFFHRDSDANQTIIWLWPKQRQTSIFFYNFTHSFQILGSNICFPNIPKSTRTVNLYSEFSCKSRFAKVNFAITSYLWKSNLTFCFWDQPTVFFGKYK